MTARATLEEHTRSCRNAAGRLDPRGEQPILACLDFRKADLQGTDLGETYLPGVNLRGSNLNRANLQGANLRGANLCESNLKNANLRWADLRGADLRGAKLPDDVPFVPNLAARIVEAIEQGGILDMAEWHTCETTHCLAGWAIHLAGKEGYALVEKMGSSASGVLIFARSGCHPIPDFYGSNEEALGALKALAGVT